MNDSLILSGVVKTAINEMIDKIRLNLDMDKLRTILIEQYGFENIKSVAYHRGDLAIENNQISLKLDFDIALTASVFFDLDGNCIFPEFEEDEDEDEGTELTEDDPTESSAVEDAALQAQKASQDF